MTRDLNKRCVVELIEAFYAGDIERALALCSDDVDFFSNAPVDILPHLGHHRGKDDVRQMWQTVHQRYSSMRNEMPFIAAEDDKVAVHLRAFSPNGSTSGSCSLTLPASLRCATARSSRFARSSTRST